MEAADRVYDAWLLDLDGTLYWAPGVKLAMGFELALLGLGRLGRLRRFRKEHELLRAPVVGRAIALRHGLARGDEQAVDLGAAVEGHVPGGAGRRVVAVEQRVQEVIGIAVVARPTQQAQVVEPVLHVVQVRGEVLHQDLRL